MHFVSEFVPTRRHPAPAYCSGTGLGYTETLTRPAGTFSHPMGEGRGEGKTVAHPAAYSITVSGRERGSRPVVVIFGVVCGGARDRMPIVRPASHTKGGR